MSFLDFCFSSNWERERESGIQNLGIKEKWPQSYLSYFSTGFHWRIFLLSRANRLYSIFLHWLEEPGVPRVSDILLSSTRSKWPWVCLPRALLKNWLSYYLLSLRGRSPHFRFGVQANHLASLFSSLPVSGDPEVTKYQHLLISPLWPTFSLNGHFFDGFPLFIPTGG